MFSFTRGSVPLAILVGLSLSANSADARAQENCSQWTDWQPVGALSVLFSWRRCEVAAERHEVEWRFGNHSAEPIEFRYELYTGIVGTCGEHNKGRLFTRGKYRLNGGQRDEYGSGRKRLRRTGFEEQFWLYVCVLPMEPEP